MTVSRREELFQAGVQFGHRTQCWCPAMAPFIWGKKDGIHLINVALTDIQLTKAEKLLESIAAQGLPVLWVGTKKIAREIVNHFAQDCSSPYFANRWVGGTLTNYHEVKKAVKKMLYNVEIREKCEKSDSQSMYTKRELNLLQKKVERSKRIISGIEKLSYPIGALVVTDVLKDKVAVKEALRIGVPVIGLVDTNANPKGITVVIPCNDDLEKSLKAVCHYLSEAIKKGKATFDLNNKAEVEKSLLVKEEEDKKKQIQQRQQKAITEVNSNKKQNDPLPRYIKQEEVAKNKDEVLVNTERTKESVVNSEANLKNENTKDKKPMFNKRPEVMKKKSTDEKTFNNKEKIIKKDKEIAKKTDTKK